MYQNCYKGDGMTATDPVQRHPVEVLATIRLPRGKRLAIGKEIESLLDALAVEGSVGHVDALFLRVYRETK
jgi:hypothetical protein